tara:strand:- start:37 stop:408 length:372 start_codon:yes stop_codon:yes gene_type:complete
MIKYLAIPLILVGCTAPVTDPPAHACSPRLDGKPTYCPSDKDLILVKPVELPKEQLKGEIDIYNPHHWQSIQMMFQRNMRKGQIEQNATIPSDAINNAIAEFNYGNNDTTEQEELLQLSGDGD